MDVTLEIGSVDRLPEDIGELVDASELEGFRFVTRLRDDWEAAVNRFDAPGESFLIARARGRLVGCCGLNVDPYTTAVRVGRVRRLYVLPEHRRGGIGRALVDTVIEAARESFDELRLRTRNPDAAAFYEAIGFDAVRDDEFCTHRMRL